MDTEQSGLWIEDEPGEPTVAEIEARDAPEWALPRERTKRKHRKRKGERVPNPCKCYGYASTGKIGPRAKRPETAYDLCECQISLAFSVAYPDHHPANDCRGLFLLDCTEEDRLHIEWVCLLNLGNWVPKADREFVPECPTDLLAVFAAVRAGRAVRDQVRSETCPPMADLIAAKVSGNIWEIYAAQDALELWERVVLLQGLGMNQADIALYTDPASQPATHYTH